MQKEITQISDHSRAVLKARIAGSIAPGVYTRKNRNDNLEAVAAKEALKIAEFILIGCGL